VPTLFWRGGPASHAAREARCRRYCAGQRRGQRSTAVLSSETTAGDEGYVKMDFHRRSERPATP